MDKTYRCPDCGQTDRLYLSRPLTPQGRVDGAAPELMSCGRCGRTDQPEVFSKNAGRSFSDKKCGSVHLTVNYDVKARLDGGELLARDIRNQLEGIVLRGIEEVGFGENDELSVLDWSLDVLA